MNEVQSCPMSCLSCPLLCNVGSQGFDKFYANMARGREVLLVREPTALELHYCMSVIRSTVTAALSCCALRPGGQLIYSG